MNLLTSRLAGTAFKILGVLIGASSAPSAISAEPVTVYTKSPALLEEQAGLERVLSQYTGYKEKWESQQHVTLAYTVRQMEVGLIIPDTCEGLPYSCGL